MDFEPTKQEIDKSLAEHLKLYRERGWKTDNYEMLRNMVIKNLRIQKQYANAVADKPVFIREVSLEETKDLISQNQARFESDYVYEIFDERLEEIRDVINKTYQFTTYELYDNAPFVIFAYDDKGTDRFFIFNHTKNMFIPVCEAGYRCLARDEVYDTIKKNL